MLHELLRDLRLGARQLTRSPGFFAAAALTLAIGIGANTAIGSAVHAILQKPLPHPEPERLVLLWTRLDQAGIDRNGVSPPELMDLAGNDAFEEVGGVYDTTATLSLGGEPERIRVAFVSPNVFTLLRTEPTLGRAFLADEAVPGRGHVAALSHQLWRRRFAERPDVLGASMSLDGETHSIVGVLPPDFRFPLGEADLFVPLALSAEELSEDERGSHYLDVLARLAPGVTVDSARTSMDALAARLDRDHPDAYRDAGFGISLGPLREQLVEGARTPLLVLLGAVALVLLIACANIANLLIVRAAGRGREMAVRTALGAGRGRIAQQLFAESFLLALAGGALGILVAVWAVDLIHALAPGDFPRLAELRVDRTALGFAALLACATGIVFGLAPSLSMPSRELPDRLKEGARGMTLGRRGRGVRRLLVVLETAMALALLVAASLLLRSLRALERVDPGVDPANLLTLRVALPAMRYPEEKDTTSFRERLLPEISRIPGVRRVAITNQLPLGGTRMSQNYTLEGPTFLDDQDSEVELTTYLVTPGYLETLGIPRLQGLDFSDSDTASSPYVAIVDERLAARLWPDESAVGKRIRVGGPSTLGAPWRTIIGVAGHVHQERLDSIGREQVYLPFPQRPPAYARSLFVAVKTDGDPETAAPAVARSIHSIDPELAVFDVATMERRVSTAMGQPRFRTLLLTLFSLTALALAAIGIYGVVAQVVSERERESAVRIALGARPAQIALLVLRESASSALLGIGLGTLGAAAGARILGSLLFGIDTFDAVAFLGAPVVLALVALVSSYLPARRATCVDPIAALRSE
jgi:putative ABC transport system permease protein